MEQFEPSPVKVNNGRSLSYRSYLSLLDNLVDERKWTGSRRENWMAAATAVNFVKIQQLYQRLHLKEELVSSLRSLKRVQNWVVLTESWSVDAANALPVFARAAEVNPLINFEIVLPESEDPVLKKLHRLNGGEIPTLLIFDEARKLLGQWGPRPKALQQIFAKCLKAGENSSDDRPSLCDKLHPYTDFINQWYREDRCVSIQRELQGIISNSLMKYNHYPQTTLTAKPAAGLR